MHCVSFALGAQWWVVLQHQDSVCGWRRISANPCALACVVSVLLAVQAAALALRMPLGASLSAVAVSSSLYAAVVVVYITGRTCGQRYGFALVAVVWCGSARRK